MGGRYNLDARLPMVRYMKWTHSSVTLKYISVTKIYRADLGLNGFIELIWGILTQIILTQEQL